MKAAATLLACASLLLLAGCTQAAPRAPGDNVLVVVLDDVGVDKLAAYRSSGAPPTPHLDALAARGVVFENAYAPPACSPSRAAMLTGRLPRRFGLGEILRGRRDRYELPLGELTLPELVRQSPAAYRSAAVGKWHLSTLQSPHGARHPLVSGFESHAGSLANLSVTRQPGTPGDYFRWEKSTDGALAFTGTYATTDTANDAIARIEAMRDEPWLLWLAWNAAHKPLHAPPSQLTGGASAGTDRERFDAMLTAVDTELGRVLAALDPELLARTHVLVVGDNGTPPGLGASTQTKGSLAEGGVHVPLILAGPEVRSPGSTSAALVHVVDVFATVAEIAGVPLEELRDSAGRPIAIDGHSLLPYVRDPGAPSRRELVYQDKFGPNGPGPYRRDLRMARDARFKLIESSTGAQRLYDLAAAGEDADLLAGGDLEPAQRIARARLAAHIAERVAELDADRASR